MKRFFHGERVILTSKVVFLDQFEYNNNLFARIAFEDKPFSFIVPLSSLSGKDVCAEAPFPKCNNAEGCDTCEYGEDRCTQ